MMRTQIGIGEWVHFLDRRGTTREGRVVGRELVAGRDLLKRTPGLWLLVALEGDGEMQIPAERCVVITPAG